MATRPPGRSGNEVSRREHRDEEGFTPESLLPAFSAIPAREFLRRWHGLPRPAPRAG